MSVEITPKAKSHCTPWPDEQTARLRKLIAKRLTASAIAGELGLAKGAVSGKARRLGLSILGGPQPPTPEQIAQRQAAKAARDAAAAARRTAQRRPAPNTGGARKVAAIRAQQAKVFGETRVKPVYAVSTNGAVTEKNPGHAPRTGIRERAFAPLLGCEPVPFGSPGCRWPVSGSGAEVLACGARRSGQSYCATHADLASSKWQPAPDQEVAELKWKLAGGRKRA